MFGLFTPISYNTNLNAVFGGYTAYYSYGCYNNNYSPFASVFTPMWNNYGGMVMSYPYFNNYYNNYYPNMYAYNYSYPVNFGGGQMNTVPVSTPSTSAPSTTTTRNNNSGHTNPIHSSTTTNTSAVTQKKPTANEKLGEKFVKIARKYSNCSEFDGSHRKFCINPTCKYDDPNDQEWCTDFVTYVVKEAYQNAGKSVPDGFGTHDVRTMKRWAIRNGYFINTANKSQKGKFISENIKPGDIMIINENNYSHTGFVTKVDSDGIIHTIEGNRDDRVKEYHYSPDYPNLSGFIRLTS